MCHRVPAAGRPRGISDNGSAGQSLAEFALIIPLFMVLLLASIEFALAFNALLNTNYASRNGGLMASQAGNIIGADCLILESIESVVNAPVDKTRIDRVEVQRTNPLGTVVHAANIYRRTGSTTCTFNDGTTRTVPYSRVSTGYPEGQRCNVLPPQGCPTLNPPRMNVDTIAVQVAYDYAWITPLPGLITLIDGSMRAGGHTFEQRNVFRMEPKL